MTEPVRPAMPQGKYISLVTFRRDGREVATPVWFAESGGRIYTYTAGEAGKVKRLRHTPRVRIAECTVGGRVTGPWRAGQGALIENPEAMAAVFAGLRRKYGWAHRIATWLSWISGRSGSRRVIEIVLDPS